MPPSMPSVKAVFDRALEIESPAEREAYLAAACPGAPDLRQKVEELLRAYAEAGSFLEPPSPDATGAYVPDLRTVDLPSDNAPTGTFSPEAHRLKSMATGAHYPEEPTDTYDGTPARPDHSNPTALGSVIAGRYTLVEVIGEGGMGSVYLASQSEPVKRQVALKLIKSGMDSKAVLARFDAERQALALMDHPNIARIYDGGVTPAGQPFFVMELVKGMPLTEYCDTHRLTVDARLQLFVAVCQAVQHAHQKGIIHRDLKPGNVLVTEVDGRATPKVIDFGVAKATELKLTDLSFADTEAIVGTPAYMSPEQADPTSMDIDTRTDVYALGVMLYELLTGSPPIDSKQFKRGAILEMLRMVREVEPPRPSTRLSTADALPNIAASRSIDPAKLAKLLQGELDWVVMKALEKDRTRRYDTANGFAADILRYRADEVVEARPPSRGYRLKKFVKRNRGQVLGGSLVLLTLIAGVVVSAYFAVVAGKEATAARKAEGASEAEAKAAREAEADAKWQARLANDARHAIQIDQALRAREEKDYDRMAALLGEMRPEYQDAWETRYVRTVWRRETPLRATLTGHLGKVTSAAFSPDGTRVVTASLDQTARVWDAATGRETAVLKGHTGRVRTAINEIDPSILSFAMPVMIAAFSPDGTRIVTASDDQTARIWDAATGRELATLKHKGEVFGAAFSPDGTRVVTAGGDGTARVWDAATGQEKAALKGHTQQIMSVAFSPDGTRVVTASNDQTARIWDAATGRETAVLKGHTEAVIKVAFSPDGTRIVTASLDQTARVWDAATGQEKAVLKGHTKSVISVAFSPDGTRVVTGSGGYLGAGDRDYTGRVWDAATGREIAVLKGHTDFLVSVAFSPDGTRIVTASRDKTTRVWDAENGRERMVLKGHANEIMSVAFSPDGTRVVTASEDRTARVWNAWTGQEQVVFKGHFGGINVAFSPDGTRFVTVSGGERGQVWDAATGREKAVLTGAFGAVAFSPDGTRVVTRVVTGSGDQAVRVWDAATGQEKAILKGHTDPVRSFAFSPEGTRVVTASGGRFLKGTRDVVRFGSPDNTGRVWDAATGQEKVVLKGHTEAVVSVAFSPDGTRILTASWDNTARVWDSATGQEVAILKGHTEWIESAVFSPDGTRIATRSRDNTARVWDPATGHEKAILQHKAPVESLAFSPDGTRIATGGDDGSARVWDAATGQEVANLKGHTGSVESVAFSPDGTRVVTASMDKTARVWDSASGQEMVVLKGHTEAVMNVVFSPDGTRIVTGSFDSTARACDDEPGREMRRFERTPTFQERLWAVLRGKDKPADNVERLAFAQLAYDQKKFAAASRLWGEALTSDPKLGDDRRTPHRYNAACAAALTATGQGQNEPNLDDAAKAKLRRQALDWLKAELAAWDKLLPSGPPGGNPFEGSDIVKTLSHWQKDPILAGIRDATALAKLPADEQKAFTQLWADVGELLKKAEVNSKWRPPGPPPGWTPPVWKDREENPEPAPPREKK